MFHIVKIVAKAVLNVVHTWPLLSLYAVALILLPLSVGYGSIIDDNTGSYIDAWSALSQGHLHVCRTPVYPIYLGMMIQLFGDQNFKIAAVIGQFIVFFLSVKPFYCICNRLINSRKVAWLTALFYAAYSGTVNQSFYVLTEPFAMTGMVFFLYCLLRLYDSFSYKYGIFTALLLVYLLMLRPIFIYLLPILFVFWGVLILRKQRRPQVKAGLLATSASTVVLLIYMTIYMNAYGIFSMSNINTINRFETARQYGLLNPDVIENLSLRSYIKKSYELHGQRYEGALPAWHSKGVGEEIKYVFAHYDLKTIKDALDASDRSHPLRTITAFGGRAITAIYIPMFEEQIIWENINIGMNIIYFLFLLYTIIVTKWIYLRKSFPCLSLVLYSIAFANLFVAIASAQSEWPRLIVPSLPIFVLLFGQLCTMYVRKPFKKIIYA